MPVAGDITVELRGVNVGLSELLSRVQNESQRGGDAAIRLAQSYARLAAAQGQPAAGARILADALRNTQGVSERAAAAAQAQINTLQRGVPIAQQYGQAVSSSLTSIIGPAALVTGAIAGLKRAFDSFGEAFTFATNLAASKRAIDAQLTSVRDSGTVWNEAAAFASKYKITNADMTSTIQASVSVMRLSTASTTDLLTTLSRLQVLAPEKPISEAARALRELATGDVTSVKELFNIGAKDALRMKNEIQGGADAVSVLSKYLDSAGIGMDALAAKTTGAAGAMRDVAIAEEQMKLAQAGFAQGPGLDILRAKIEVITGATRLLSGEVGHAGDATQASILASAHSYDAYAAGIANANAQLKASFAGDPVRAALMGQLEGLKALPAAQFAYAQSLIATGVAQGQAVARAQAMAPTLERIANVQTVLAGQGQTSAAAISALATSMQQVATSGAEGVAFVQGLAVAVNSGAITAAQAQLATDQYAAAQLRAAAASAEEEREQRRLSGALVESNSEVNAQSAALADQAQKTLDASLKTDQLNRFQATLAQLGGAVAGGLQTSASAAAALAAQYNITTAAALALINAQAALGQAKVNAAALSDQRAGERSGGAVSSFDDLTRSSDIARKKAQDLAAAQREAILATGTHAQQVALLRGELGRLVPGTADYIRKQTELNRELASGKKAGGGGKGVKLSDQQKLNNSLLTDQEKYQDKSEDAELAHARKLLDIERDFAQKSLEQQRANEVSKRASRFSFYSSLSSAAKDLGGQEAQQYSAAYEAAFAESQALAAAGNKKQAADLLSLRQKQIQEDIEAAKAVAEAKKNNDAAEVERLQALETLRKDAQKEELDQVRGGGDADVAAKNKALADENARYEEAQGKIAESAERSAERKVTAAERAGKKIDEEKLKLDELAKAYDKVAPARGAPTTGSTPAGTSTVPVATGPLDLGAVVGALNGAQAAIVAAVQAVERAVRSGAASGNIAG
jgi:hypothetical protein